MTTAIQPHANPVMINRFAVIAESPQNTCYVNLGSYVDPHAFRIALYQKPDVRGHRAMLLFG